MCGTRLLKRDKQLPYNSNATPGSRETSSLSTTGERNATQKKNIQMQYLFSFPPSSHFRKTSHRQGVGTCGIDMHVKDTFYLPEALSPNKRSCLESLMGNSPPSKKNGPYKTQSSTTCTLLYRAPYTTRNPPPSMCIHRFNSASSLFFR